MKNGGREELCRVDIGESEHPHWLESDVFRDGVRTVNGCMLKNYSKGMHIHDFYEGNIVTSGSGIHYIGNSAVRAECGDVFIVPPGVRHGYGGGEGFDVYHFHLSWAFMGKHSAELSLIPGFRMLFGVEPLVREYGNAGYYLKLDRDTLVEIAPLLDGLRAHSRSSDAASAIMASSFAVLLIANLCRAYSRTEDCPTADSDTAFLGSIAYVYENYGKKITVDDLSRMAAMSRNSYIAKFKRATGTTPAELITDRRISAARLLLSDSAMPLAEIADEVGFFDASHLVREFRKRVGVTPAEYRRTSRGR